MNLDGEDDDLTTLPQLVGQVIERESDGSIPLPPSLTNTVASPVAGRREESGFPVSSRLEPFEAQEQVVESTGGEAGELSRMLSSISKANDDVLTGLSDREIIEEQRQIRESMGLSESVIKMLEERGRKKATPDIKKVLIRPPTVIIAKPISKPLEEEEEGTPEYIRRHFFPNEPTNPNLDWMRDPTPSSSTLNEATNLPTFDLSGEPLATETFESIHASSSHHVSSSTSFTLPSLLSLTTSAVSSQRSTSLLVLARILNRSQNQSLLGKKVWTALRIDSGRCASWAIRDSNLGVSTAAISLLQYLLAEELDLFISTDQSNIERLAPGAEEPITLVSAFLSTDPYPSLTRQLSSSSLDIQSHQAILSILHSILLLSSKGQPTSLAVEELVASPSLLESLSKRFISVLWPSDSPSILALEFYIDLAKSSRARAKALCDRKLIDSGLRFLGILPWELELEHRSLGYRLVGKVLEYWDVIGRYGFATSLRTRAAPLFDSILSKFSTLYLGNKIDQLDIRIMIKMFKLLEIWTTAAVDPHTTEHDILWTQVDEWSNIAVEAHKWVLTNASQEVELLGSIWQLLGSWLEGSKVNQSWRGEEQRNWLASEIGNDLKVAGKGRFMVNAALVRLGASSILDIDATLVSAALRLSRAYEEDSNPSTPALIVLDSSTLPPLFASIFTNSASSRAINRLLVDLLSLVPSLYLQLSSTIQVLNLLAIDDVASVRTLLNWTISTLSDSTNHDQLLLDPTIELPSLANLGNLTPFITFALNTTVGGKSISPLHPTTLDLQKATRQYPFASSAPLLTSNWPLVALDELLRSGTSPVFENLPDGWDASELDLVKTSLALMRVTEACKSTSATVLVYDLIKIFMLEKDNTTSGTVGAESDLFRDTNIEYSMNQLLLPLTISNQPLQVLIPDKRTSNETIERVSSKVSSAPFYRLYTDLVGLFDSISMSHSIFARILLPPLAMSYPIDYRKLLWTDYSHILNTIKTSTENAITDKVGQGALSSYLYPIETDLSVLVAYGQALVSKKVTEENNEFLYFIALHHLSLTLFGDQMNVDHGSIKKLTKAIVGQGGTELVEKLLNYEQVLGEGETLSLLPECYVKEGARRSTRENRLNRILES